MKKFLALILALLLIPAVLWATGATTTNGFFYKPPKGATGAAEKALFDAGFNRVDARLAYEAWVGDPLLGATLPLAVTALGTTNPKHLRLTPATYTLAADLTIPANLTLKPERGAVIAIPTGKTLTINGGLAADPTQQVFSCTGTGKVVFGATSPITNFYPEWFGAVGDGATDDLAALNACRDAMLYSANLGRGVLHLGRWYAVSSTFSLNNIGINNNTSFALRGIGKSGCGLIGTTACDGKPILEMLGSPLVELYNFGLKGVADVGGAVPEAAPSVALLLGVSDTSSNAGNCRFKDLGIWGFFRFGLVYNWGMADAVFDGITSYTSPLDSGEYAFDWYFGATWFTRQFTSIVPTNAGFTALTAFGTEGNELRHVYIDSTTNKAYKVAGHCSIYQHGAVPYLRDTMLMGDFDYQIIALNCGVNLHNTGGDGHGDTAGIYVGSDEEGNSYPNCTAEVVIDHHTNSLSNGIALMTDEYTTLKNSTVSYLRGNNGFRVQLGAGAIGCQFINNETLKSFVVEAGAFQNNVLEVPETCANLDLSGCGTSVSNNLIHDSRYASNQLIFAGRSVNGHPLAAFGYPGMTDPASVRFGLNKLAWYWQAPDVGSWRTGDVVWNTGASAGGAPGWVCTGAGTFGTLSGITGSIANGSKTLTVNSTSGINVGDFLKVVADGGGYATDTNQVLNVDTENNIVTLLVAAYGDATGKAVSYQGSPTFKAMANLAP